MNLKKSYSLEEIQQKMANYCIYQDRCHYDVEKKLSEYDLIPEAKDHILLFLIQHDFLNEERFAKSFARGKFNQKHWGKNRIKRELKFRKINNRLVDIALLEIDSRDYFKTLEMLYLKKNKEIKESNPYKKRQKIYQHLIYKGFESDLILDLMKD
ncbi:regulatory protein RecX [Flavobacteriaceae bacterium UJ101]|nr:regulatory protein RecX [Flavobacteriaceae bacterium UJ101]